VQTRRAFLHVALLAGAGTLAAACGAPVSPGSVSLDQPTTTAASQPKPAAPAQPATGAPGGIVVFGASSEARTLNPLLANDGASQSVWELLFEPLVKPDPKTGAPVAALAERWDQSSDGLTYTFHIRPGVTWSDGQPLTAEDA
jgi:peptide/nickel transport system substrate-binding protein